MLWGVALIFVLDSIIPCMSGLIHFTLLMLSRIFQDDALFRLVRVNTSIDVSLDSTPFFVLSRWILTWSIEAKDLTDWTWTLSLRVFTISILVSSANVCTAKWLKGIPSYSLCCGIFLRPSDSSDAAILQKYTTLTYVIDSRPMTTVLVWQGGHYWAWLRPMSDTLSNFVM